MDVACKGLGVSCKLADDSLASDLTCGDGQAWVH